MNYLPHAMLQITLESSFHLSLSPAIFLNMSKSSLVLNCLTSISFLMFPSTSKVLISFLRFALVNLKDLIVCGTKDAMEEVVALSKAEMPFLSKNSFVH